VARAAQMQINKSGAPLLGIAVNRVTAPIGGYARALKSRRQLRHVIRLPALLAELCRIVHR
jgi:hypothetical protein